MSRQTFGASSDNLIDDYITGGQGATESGQHRGASWCFISSKAEDCDQSEDDDQSEEDNQSEEDARPEYVDLVKLASGMKISNQDKVLKGCMLIKNVLRVGQQNFGNESVDIP